MEIGAAWKKTAKSGVQYMSIIIELPLLGKLQCALFVNDKKTSENQPDFKLVYTPKQEKSNQNTFSNQGNQSEPALNDGVPW